jgi:sugar phosphate isomerase/epimerase
VFDRRDLIKWSLGAALARAADKHRFFTSEEYALVDELTEMIIPADEHSGGAKAANVAGFIDQKLAEAFDGSERDDWRKQLAIVNADAHAAHQKTFLKCSDEQKLALVTELEKKPFFATLKTATVHGYYSSRIGIHDEMGYLGNTLQQGEYSGSLPPHTIFPTDPRERLAVASYPFRKLVDLKTGSLPLVDFPKMIADRFGVHGVELLGEHFPATDPAYLDQLRAALEKIGSRVVNIPVDRLNGSFYDADAAARNRAIFTARHWIDAAAGLGSPGVRLHIVPAKTALSVSLAAESLKHVADYGESKNVVVHLENDDAHSEEAFFLVDVIKAANTLWLRALPDFCNSMLLERGDEYNYKGMAALFDHAYGICHVKDSEQDGKKMFRVDLARTFAIAKAAGYRGYFSMEYDAEGDPFEPTEALIKASLEALA